MIIRFELSTEFTRWKQRVTKLELTGHGFVSLAMGGSVSRIDLLLDLVAEATEQHVESLFTPQVIFVIVIDDVAQIE